MDLQQLITGMRELFPQLHAHLALNYVVLVKQEHWANFHYEVNVQYDTHQDRLSALLDDCERQLAEMQAEWAAKNKIALKSITDDMRKAWNLSAREREKRLQAAEKKYFQNDSAAYRTLQREYNKLAAHYHIASRTIVQNYRRALLAIVKKYKE